MKASKALLTFLSALLIGMTLLGFPPTRAEAQTTRVMIKVLAASIDVHALPDASAPVMGKLRQNGLVVLSGISADGNWFYFLYYNKPAWIPADPTLTTFVEGSRDGLKVIDPQAVADNATSSGGKLVAGTKMLIVGDQPAKLYARPDTSVALTTLPVGTMVRLAIGPSKSTWWWVRTEQGQGWMQTSTQVDGKSVDQLTPMTAQLLAEDIKTFSDQIKADPGNAAAYMRRGLAYYNQKDYDKAEADFAAIIKLKPDDAWGYFERGLVEFNRRQSDAALADFSSAIKALPQEPAFYMARGVVYGAYLKKQAEAEKDFQTAIELSADFNTVYFHQMMTRYQNDGYSENLLKGLLMVENAEPNLTDVFALAATVSLKSGDPYTALDLLNTAIKTEPTNGYFYAQLGILYAVTGDLTNAQAAMDKAAKLSPDDEGVHFYRGNFFQAFGQLAEAEAEFSKAIELNPYLGEAYVNRAGIYYQLGEFDKSFADSNRAVELLPYEPTGYLNRAAIYYDRGDSAKALADYEQYIALGGAWYDWIQSRIDELRQKTK